MHAIRFFLRNVARTVRLHRALRLQPESVHTTLRLDADRAVA